MQLEYESFRCWFLISFASPISNSYRDSCEQVIKGKDLTVERGQGNHVSVEFNVLYRVRLLLW